MLKFQFETDIQKPIEEVFYCFSNRDMIKQWQPGLLTNEFLDEKDGMKRYKLTFRIGPRSVTMTETVLYSVMPKHDVTYEMKGICNTVHNTFKALGPNSTKWISETDFKFTGLKRLISIFMKKGFEQQSQIMMKNFKGFVERAI